MTFFVSLLPVPSSLECLLLCLVFHAWLQLLAQLPKFVRIDVPAATAIAVELVEKLANFRLDVTWRILLLCRVGHRGGSFRAAARGPRKVRR